jgi:hypothetical protein
MDRIEEIIDEFSLNPREVAECQEMMHEPEFKERFYKNSEPYETVFYDVVLRYVNRENDQC